MTGINYRSVGVDTELKLASYLRSRGWAGAERYVRTGFRSPTREMADPGDIMGTINVAWQAKSLRPADRVERFIPQWMAETETQRLATRADIGVLVVRRWGITDAGRWHAFVQARVLSALFTDQAITEDWDPAETWPVRTELSHLCDLLISNGYGGDET